MYWSYDWGWRLPVLVLTVVAHVYVLVLASEALVPLAPKLKRKRNLRRSVGAQSLLLKAEAPLEPAVLLGFVVGRLRERSDLRVEQPLRGSLRISPPSHGCAPTHWRQFSIYAISEFFFLRIRVRVRTLNRPSAPRISVMAKRSKSQHLKKRRPSKRPLASRRAAGPRIGGFGF